LEVIGCAILGEWKGEEFEDKEDKDEEGGNGGCDTVTTGKSKASEIGG